MATPQERNQFTTLTRQIQPLPLPSCPGTTRAKATRSEITPVHFASTGGVAAAIWIARALAAKPPPR
eukprot:1041671-Alexandrium_andersonii.AAC.1